MNYELTPGMKGTADTTVSEANTAAAMGSGSLPVFATPAMTALMEAAAVSAVALPSELTSVGTALHISHLAATPLHQKVQATALLTAVSGRRLSFTVQAFDEQGLIGEGTHERCIVDSTAFLAKANAKNS